MGLMSLLTNRFGRERFIIKYLHRHSNSFSLQGNTNGMLSVIIKAEKLTKKYH